MKRKRMVIAAENENIFSYQTAFSPSNHFPSHSLFTYFISAAKLTQGSCLRTFLKQTNRFQSIVLCIHPLPPDSSGRQPHPHNSHPPTPTQTHVHTLVLFCSYPSSLFCLFQEPSQWSYQQEEKNASSSTLSPFLYCLQQSQFINPKRKERREQKKGGCVGGWGGLEKKGRKGAR